MKADGPWGNFLHKGWQIHFAGSHDSVSKLSGELPDEEATNPESLGRVALEMPGCFGMIARKNDQVVIVGDRIRGYPVFYSLYQERVSEVSFSARALMNDYQEGEVESISRLELAMSGYCTGSRTIFKHIKQLRAGELMTARIGEKPQLLRYYTFDSQGRYFEGTTELIDELAARTDRIFNRLVEKAGERPVLVPLSGGLDSRLVLSKLVQHGCQRLEAFSYGPPGNHEAKAAKSVAERLGVKWRFVPSRRKQAREYFRSQARKRFWEYADNLCSIPFMQDIIPLRDLRSQGLLPDDAIVVNGQSGDFISGGHIPFPPQEQANFDTFFAAVTKKHFSLWEPLQIEENCRVVRESFLEVVGEEGRQALDETRWADLWDLWEWQERQAKYVVQGQRCYDFLGLDWALPLWEREYTDFWPCVPPTWRFRQKLYLDYLVRYDYKGLFAGFKPVVWRWPGASILILAVAQIIGLAGGRKRKDLFYKYASYFGHYSNHYVSFGLCYFLQNIQSARGAVAFYADVWLRENLGRPAVDCALQK